MMRVVLPTKTRQDVINWLNERHENCLRLAKTKPAAEQAGWMEDAGYFLIAVALLSRETMQ